MESTCLEDYHYNRKHHVERRTRAPPAAGRPPPDPDTALYSYSISPRLLAYFQPFGAIFGASGKVRNLANCRLASLRFASELVLVLSMEKRDAVSFAAYFTLVATLWRMKFDFCLESRQEMEQEVVEMIGLEQFATGSLRNFGGRAFEVTENSSKLIVKLWSTR
ncbi:hypothetical protein TcasGA2_TC003772 [Tribolium castaneum]|uniref:Uncharacterized protein n=1 Tax=Tribolium castaneum TaxID=7070 RepID=D6WEM2_TRICA|nr:hypothetical protein TcasGA2_TC003772 [Tribolium castaneum]